MLFTSSRNPDTQRFKAHTTTICPSTNINPAVATTQRISRLGQHATIDYQENMDIPDGASAPCWSPKIGALVEHDPNCGLRDNQKDNRFVGHKADYDADDRFELFLLDDGQSKVEYKEETREYSPSSPSKHIN
jgi:hypothetical protein